MTPPEGATEGSTFDALATLTLGADSLTLVAIDGLPVGEAQAEAVEEAPAEAASELGFEEAIRNGIMEGP